MPERETFNEFAAKHILNAEVSDLPPHPRFGDGMRFATPSGRNLDVFDGAVGVNGRKMNLLFDTEDLTVVYERDSVGFAGTLDGIPLSFRFHGDTGEVVFDNTSPPTDAVAEESSPPGDGAPGRAATEPGPRIEDLIEASSLGTHDARRLRGLPVAEDDRQAAEPGTERDELVSLTGHLGRRPGVFLTEGKPTSVKLAVAEHVIEEAGEGKEKTVWHEVWAAQKIVPRVAAMVETGILKKGTAVQIKGYALHHEPTGNQTEGKPFIRAVVVNPIKPGPR